MSRAMPEGIDAAAAALIESVTGFKAAASAALPKGKSLTSSRKNLQVADDLRFFRAIALQSEARSPMFKGARTASCVWPWKPTRRAERQLIRCSWRRPSISRRGHDAAPRIGVAEGRPHDGRRKGLAAQSPGYAAGLVQRMDGWEEAARMIAQHHEMPDGGGYPPGRQGG